MPPQRVGGVRLAYEEEGSGDPILLVAGGFLDMDQWAPVAEILGVRHRTIRYDLRGGRVGQADRSVHDRSVRGRHGGADGGGGRVVAVANARLLAETIPGT